MAQGKRFNTLNQLEGEQESAHFMSLPLPPPPPPHQTTLLDESSSRFSSIDI